MNKKLSITLFVLLLAAAVAGQGVSRLFGLVGGTPQSNQTTNGFLFSTDSTGNNAQMNYSFPVTVFGANPANLEMAPWNGKLYGTTSRGGLSDFGTIFEYDPVTNVYTKKFDFGPNPSVTGGSPKGSLLLYNNKFYGLAADYAVNGAGCLFEWDPATNVYTKKFDFGGAHPGSSPQNSLRLMNGKMYGTTASGGGSNIGTVFEWDPVTNASTMLLEMNGTNGWGFYSNVTPYNNKLYCMSQQAAANGYGALYMIDPALPYGSNTTIIKQFDATSGGAAGNNEMIVYNNKLYGCLSAGGASSGGTLFELSPVGNVFTKLADFDYTTSGNSPVGKLVANGSKFLGLCSSGGANGTGTVYEWDPASPNALVKKFNFPVNNYDNPVNPGSTFAFYGSKFYAVTYNSGFVNQGVLFEYDYVSNNVAKKLTFNAAENGRIPFGRPVLLNGKIYGTCQQGPQEIFGTPYGCLWSYDPSSNVYSRRFIFDNTNNAANGRNPTSSPIAYNGKLYGTTTNGGVSDYGVLYEFDPATSGYVKKNMQPIAGSYPIGEPTAFNNKLYGMTSANGAGNNGIIYSYDPANGTLAKVYDVQNSGGNAPNGGFTVYNNKLYGTTNGGGANSSGAIIAYDPVANTASVQYSLSGATGSNIANAMTLYNNKFYGTALSGSANGRGCIFQFDPATNAYAVLYSFVANIGLTGYDPKGELTVSGGKLYCITSEGSNIVYVIELDPVSNAVTVKSTITTTNNNLPITHNGLTVVPAFIATGTANSCEAFPTVVIDASNNNKWVPILNAAGDVLAEIKANGNNLGVVSASVYINNGPVREDGGKRLYLDRNLAISTQNPVASGTVDLRLYIKNSEFLALKNATNSIGQPSGVNTMNDLAVFKNAQACSSAVYPHADRIPTTASAYEYGYVLDISVSSFSSFYFSNKIYSIVPLTLVGFEATKQAHRVKLNWVTENEINVSHYEIERSATGNSFVGIANVAAKNNLSRSNYDVTDNAPFKGSNYYRLKMVDKDGRITYSTVLRVNFNGELVPVIQPNPAADVVTIKNIEGYQQLQVLDLAGRVVLKQPVNGSMQQLDISGLASGVYSLRMIRGEEVILLKLVKQ